MKDISRYVGKFCVVETTQRQYVGVFAQTADDDYTVLTGVAGRPPVFDLADIDDITLVTTSHKKEK